MTHEQAIEWCARNYANICWLTTGEVWITNSARTVDIKGDDFIEAVEFAVISIRS